MNPLSPWVEILMLVSFLCLVLGCSILYGKRHGKFEGSWDQAIGILLALLAVGVTTFSIAAWAIIDYATSV